MQEKVKGSCVLLRTEEKKAKDKYIGQGGTGSLCVLKGEKREEKLVIDFCFVLGRNTLPSLSFGPSPSLSYFVQLFGITIFHSLSVSPILVLIQRHRISLFLLFCHLGFV